MRRHSAGDILLKALGLLLLTAAVLKGHELLTVPVANRGLWTWRPFLIFQVEFELALGLWLLSGVFKRLAWLAALLCFSLFCCVTLYKALSGATSCGCFGTVHVNPWLTLLTIDLPAVVVLTLFHPPSSFTPGLSFLRRQESVSGTLGSFLRPMPSLPRFAVTAALGLTILGLTTPILVLNEPALVTSTYEVLEPETWVGKELPILEHIDIADQLKQGTWLVVLYQYDCPHCREAIPKYERMAHDLSGTQDSLQVALVAMPPYARATLTDHEVCALGHLSHRKQWFVATPAIALMKEGVVNAAWEGQAPDPGAVLGQLSRLQWSSSSNAHQDNRKTVSQKGGESHG